MPDPIKYVQGNTAPPLRLRLQDERTGNAVDVSSAAVHGYLRRMGAASVLALTATKPGGGLDGDVVFTWPSAAFSAAGMYEFEWEIVYASGDKESGYDKIHLEAREKVAP